MIGLSSSAQQAFSDFLGYTSIACWLGAQFPCTGLENIRSNSCEGLALPFLANWLMGDVSNLIGCILTHQLPFQTYLAIYFVFVDCTLVGQYIYYSWKSPPPVIPHRRRMSIDRSATRYRTLSVVAGNVAKAAALAALHDEHVGPPRRSTRKRGSQDHFPETSMSRVSRESDDEVDESALSALADSFHSEGGRHARVSWSVERSGRRGGSVGRPSISRATSGALHVPTTESPTMMVTSDSLIRGRSLQREAEIFDEHAAADAHHRRSKDRRGSSMIFFGVWALFSFGFFAGNLHGLPSYNPSSNVGKVLFARNEPIPSLVNLPSTVLSPPGFNSDEDVSTFEFRPSDSTFQETSEPTNERVLGRIFAWLCTTLYLTSRLPQIWKNYVRQSVQGLSIYLFIFAFLGNTFYVASILASPNVYLPAPASTDFIKESIPYLLGSGGTLIFDITIVMQAFIYRPKRHKRASVHDRAMEEERLLESDALVNSVLLSSCSMSLIPRHPTHSVADPTPYQLRALVLDYLSHQCYTRTARAFAKDSAVRHLDADGDEVMSPDDEPSLPQLSEVVLEKANLRAQVRAALLAGKVDEATDLLNKHFPTVLNADDSTPRSAPLSVTVYVASTSVEPSHLTLNLRIQSFIESCRTVPLPYPPADAGSETPKSQKRTSQALDDDDPKALDQQTALLKSAQKLYALASLLFPPDREKYIKELGSVLGILAYKIPEESSVSKYLSQERRAAVAEQINSAILYRSGLPVIPKVELVTRRTSTLWGFCHDLHVPVSAGALLPPRPGKDTPVPSLKGTSANANKDEEHAPTFDFSQFMDLDA
ncbi:hypothetical protein BDZ89DRAFT_1004845 [Hymenopellis radicata]|nr:hypothetical protein BDZ89DRAFT_1004845 [Hymenopellis radicata]